MAGVAACGGKAGAVACGTGVGWAACNKLYKQARLCPSVGALQNVWMYILDAALFPNAFSIGATCYYFDAGDAPSATPGTIYPASVAVAAASCDTCPTPTPCTCPTTCDNYIINFTASVQIYNSLAGGCVGVPIYNCPPTVGTSGVSDGMATCSWLYAGSTFPCNVSTFADPVMQLITGPAHSPPCYWQVAFAWSDLVHDTAFFLLNSTSGATPETAFFPSQTTCFQDATTGDWVQVTITITSIVCDDSP